MDGRYSTRAKQILQKKKDLSYFLQCVGLPCADGTQQTSVVLIVYRRRGKKKTDIVDKVLVLKMLNVYLQGSDAQPEWEIVGRKGKRTVESIR